MDEDSNKGLKAQLRHRRRNPALPLPIPQLEAIVPDVEDRAGNHALRQNSRRLTQLWLVSRGHDVRSVFAWLERPGGFCDCEVLFNVEDYV